MDEIATLAAAAAATVVTAMATDGWSAVRDGVVDLFHWSRRKKGVIRDQLDGNAALVRAAATPDEARKALLGLWTLELSALLNEHPASRDALSALVEAFGGRIPEERRDFVALQSNVAYDMGVVFGAVHGDIHVHDGHAAAKGSES